MVQARETWGRRLGGGMVGCGGSTGGRQVAGRARGGGGGGGLNAIDQELDGNASADHIAPRSRAEGSCKAIGWNRPPREDRTTVEAR